MQSWAEIRNATARQSRLFRARATHLLATPKHPRAQENYAPCPERPQENFPALVALACKPTHSHMGTHLPTHSSTLRQVEARGCDTHTYLAQVSHARLRLTHETACDSPHASPSLVHEVPRIGRASRTELAQTMHDTATPRRMDLHTTWRNNTPTKSHASPALGATRTSDRHKASRGNFHTHHPDEAKPVCVTYAKIVRNAPCKGDTRPHSWAKLTRNLSRTRHSLHGRGHGRVFGRTQVGWQVGNLFV